MVARFTGKIKIREISATLFHTKDFAVMSLQFNAPPSTELVYAF